jgi:WD40 repeat protein
MAQLTLGLCIGVMMTIRVWNMAIMKQISDSLQGHTDSVRSVVVHDGKIVSESEDKTIRVWDMATMKQISDLLQGHTDSVRSVAVHDGKIVSGSDYETIRVWNMAAMKHSL